MTHGFASSRRRLTSWVGVLLAAVIVCAGCSFNPSNYVMPGTGVGGPTYRLHLEFSSLLSLPAGAEVRSNGAKVGSMRSITLTDEAAVAHIDVSEDVELPRGTRAELRQTSMLGDIYIALIPPVEMGRSSSVTVTWSPSTTPIRVRRSRTCWRAWPTSSTPGASPVSRTPSPS